MASLVVEQNIKALEKFFGDKNLKPSPNLPGAYRGLRVLPQFPGPGALSLSHRLPHL